MTTRAPAVLTKIFSCKSQGQHMKNIISQYSKLQVTRSTYMKNIISQYSIYCDISFFLLCKVQARKSIKHDFTTVVTMMMAGWWRWWWKWRWWPQARRGWSTQYRNINLFSTPPTWRWTIGSRLVKFKERHKMIQIVFHLFYIFKVAKDIRRNYEQFDG